MNISLIKYLAAGLLTVSLSACSDFLDKEVEGNPTDENYYDTAYKLQAALNATYNVLQMDAFTQSDYLFGECCGDHVICADEGLSSHMGQLVHFRFNTSNSYIRQRWEVNYKGIHYANQVIANIDRCRLATHDYTDYMRVREILGQAKFLRALFYFNLVKTFGGVPIRPEVESVDGTAIPRSSLEDTYAYIEQDLREAAVCLPARYTSTSAGKAGGGAAVALLMKVLLYQCTPGIYSDKWEEIVRLGDYFVKGTSISFAEMLKTGSMTDDEWEDLRCRLWFKPRTLNQGTDPWEGPDYEMPILVNKYGFEYQDAYGSAISYLDQWYAAGEFCRGSIFEVVFQESGDGTGGDTNEGSYIYTNLYINGSIPFWSTSDFVAKIFGNDIRKSFTIGHHEYTPDLQNTEIGPEKKLSLKWYTPIKEAPIYNDDNAKNRRMLRYVDVVLTYAEALNECGRGDLALEQLNSYKAVVNKINNSTTLYNGGGYGYMRNQIWSEREMETAFEWERFFDIVRQGRAAEMMHNFSVSRPNKRGLYFRKGINEIFPIPQTEIDLSNGVVTQNPGY